MTEAGSSLKASQFVQQHLIVALGCDKVGGEDAIEAHEGKIKVLFAALPQVINESFVQLCRGLSHH